VAERRRKRREESGVKERKVWEGIDEKNGSFQLVGFASAASRGRAADCFML
jgi:hypothetical protein